MNPIVEDVAEVRVHFTLPGNEEMINVHNVRVGAVPLTQALATVISAQFSGGWAADMAPVISNGVRLDTIVVTDLSTANGPSFEFPVGTPGDVATSMLPGQIAAVVKWKTALRGRSFQGRTYLGGFTEAGSAGQAPEAAVRTACQDYADHLIAALEASDAPLTLVSRYHQVVPGTPPTVPRDTNLDTLIISASVAQAWHTHRSRALKG